MERTVVPIRTPNPELEILAGFEVLVAEDDPHDQLLLQMAAEKADLPIRLTFVDDGAAVLRKVGDGDIPDLLVLDIRMPLLDGHETLDRLQALPTARMIPTIMFSNSRRSHDRQRSLESGAIAFRTKPSTFAELTEFLEDIFDYLLETAATTVELTDD
ncbi:MAG: response regulator [Actinomycetia bacterium]|nr:response regulator [Actinomycetes bacterium]